MSIDVSGSDAALKAALIVLSPVILQILQGAARWNFPPPDFDPLSASDEELRKYNLPPRPSPSLPRARANWERAMSKPLTFPDQKVPIEELFAGSPLRSRFRRGGLTAVTQESSQNWSGAYVRPRDFGKMALVEARWQVPNPKPSGPGDGTFASSAWVGLDGHDPASRSLPQIGTAHWVRVARGQPEPELFVWWEWWARNDPRGQQIRVPQVPVQPGDIVYARIEELTPTTVSLFVKNETSGKAFAHVYTVQDPPEPGPKPSPNPLPSHVEGRTAAWILERPAPPNHRPLEFFAMANYGYTVFQDCNAATDAGNGLEELDLERARLIRMNLWDDSARSGRLASLPRRQGKTSLRLDFV